LKSVQKAKVRARKDRTENTKFSSEYCQEKHRFTEYRFAEYEYDEIRCEDELGINPSAGRVEGLLGASISDRCHNQSSLCPGLLPCAPLGQKTIVRYLGVKRDAR